MKHSNLKIVIVGAGVAGITAAARLKAAGVNATVFEKSRSVGGRLATRQTRTGYQFDHGVQFFEAQSNAFRTELESGSWADNVDIWSPDGIVSDKKQKMYVGTPIMKQPIISIAEGLNVRVNTRIEQIERHGKEWVLSVEGENASINADMVIVSVPSVQAQEITKTSKKLRADLSKVRMEPCWAFMIAFDQKTEVPFSVLEPSHSIFSKIARTSSKPGRDQTVETWVAHANSAWSVANLEINQQDAISMLMPAFLEQMPTDCPKPAYIAAHRWRYANVAQAAKQPFLADETNTLFAIGDWCLGDRVECAFESGCHVADHILRLTDG